MCPPSPRNHEDPGESWSSCDPVQPQENLEKYRRIFESSSLLLAFTEPGEGRILDVNDAWLRATGISREEALARTGSQLGLWSQPRDRERIMDQLARDGCVERFHTPLRMGERTFPALVSARPVLLPSGTQVLWEIEDISEREWARELAEDRETKYQAIFEHSPCAMSLTRVEDGRILQVNPAWSQLLGWPREEALERTLLELGVYQDPGDRGRLRLDMDRLGKLTDWPFRCRHQDGRTMQVRISVTRIQSGADPCYLTVLLDHTSMLAAEEALRKREADLRTLFEWNSDGIVILDGETVIDANLAAAVMLRTSRTDLLRSHPWELSPPLQPDGRSSEAKAQALIRIAQADGVHTFEWTHRRQDGEDFPAEVTLIPIQLSDRPVLYCTIRDITERKRAEAEVRASEARFRTLIEDAPIAITVTRGHEIIYLNQKFVELFGLPGGEELIGQSVLACVAPSSREAILERVRLRALGLEPAPEFDTTGLRGDGGNFPLHVSTATVQLGDGPAMMFYLTDLTERLRAERQRIELQADLAQVQKMESLGSLAGGIAHDMNNVLGAILALTSANLKVPDGGEQTRSSFETIHKAALRGGEMVRSLLAFARKEPAREREEDLNALLRETLALLARTTLAKVRLDLDLAEDLRPVRGDGNALSHAFMNLCVNAVDAMGGAGALTLRSRNLPDERIEVVVEDTGCGMPRSVLERALDPFFTTKPEGQGTGLGLPMVYSTVKAHRGELQIESEPGQGTRVRVRLPACATQAAEAAPEAAAAPARSMEVLLVDDDELIRTSTGMLLGILGHRARIAGDGEEALAMLEQGYRPEVVILDMNMPGLGGEGTLPRLRALCPDLPVLLATGSLDASVEALTSRHAGVTVLPKPYTLDALNLQLADLQRSCRASQA